MIVFTVLFALPLSELVNDASVADPVFRFVCVSVQLSTRIDVDASAAGFSGEGELLCDGQDPGSSSSKRVVIA